MTTAAPPATHRTLTYWPALDGVRALAVTAVLLFHGGVAWLGGGFLGVDAFFVLSGFLITSLLLAEREQTGRIRLGGFWLRRARRLLPALLLVLVAVVTVFRDLLPRLELTLLRGDALAALGYVANWRMIYRGDDYFAQTSSPSPLQHTWSLGIEEQFYVAWPLVVVAVLALTVRLARLALVVLCLTGAAASAVVAGLLFDPYDVNRAYFGTDSRAQALLIGCAVAAALPAIRARLTPTRSAAPAPLAIVLAALSVPAVLVVGWLWSRADGSAGWLYRGGLTAGAVAMAVLLAHVVLQPRSPIARALAVPPLVWLGRISYGVYLWHWPLFLLLNHERTGLTGPGLLALRLAATLVVSVVSYVVIEQPIRTGRWPGTGRQRGQVHRGRFGPVLGGATATAVVGATAAFIVLATVPPVRVTIAQIMAVPVVPPTSAAEVPESKSPMRRPGRIPGTAPRISFFGDSVSWSIGFYMQSFPGLDINTQSMPGCGIARLPEIRYVGEQHTNYEDCHIWDQVWQARVDDVDPDVAVVLLDRWELMDRKLGEKYLHVGDPQFDAYLAVELRLALSTVSARGAHIVLLTAPYTHRWERPDGGLYPEDQPQRVDAWNRIVRSVAAERPNAITVIDLNLRVCPDGKFTWNIGRLQIRSDGLHFTPEGVQEWIAPWLVPQLANLAIYGPRTTNRGD